jgi:hypothetical protein
MDTPSSRHGIGAGVSGGAGGGSGAKTAGVDGVPSEENEIADTATSELLIPLLVKHVLERLDATDAPCSGGWRSR